MCRRSDWLALLLLAGIFGILGASAAVAGAPDVPQFRGVGRDGLSSETGLLKQWPKDGPPLLWKVSGLGRGYAAVSIVDGTLYTMGDRAAEGGERQLVMAWDLASRKQRWSTPLGAPHRDGGPRCTPTVDGERLYVVGTDGDVACLERASGKVVWKKNFAADFGGKMMSVWKYSESPLVDGEKLVCTPGGPEALVVALDKRTGSVLWKCPGADLGPRGKDGAGYCSIVVAEVDGIRQYVTVVGRGAIGVDAKTGKLLWVYNRIANNVANIPNPVVRGNHVFVTTSYSTGCALLRLSRDGDGVKAEEVYFLGPDVFENHHGGVVLVGEHIYGGSGRNNGTPVCLEFLTGKVAWKGQAPGNRSAAVLYADGNLVFRYENGVVALIEASPQEFRLRGTFHPETGKGPAWPHPVIHDGKLYLRHDDALMCYDVKAK